MCHVTRSFRCSAVELRCLPCLFQPITEGYRNKDEFNIQTGVDGNPKTVGFFVGSPAEGSVVCVRGTHLINLRQSHIKVAQVHYCLSYLCSQGVG